MTIAANWYPDTQSETPQLRWWDGAQWTEHTMQYPDIENDNQIRFGYANNEGEITSSNQVDATISFTTTVENVAITRRVALERDRAAGYITVIDDLAYADVKPTGSRHAAWAHEWEESKDSPLITYGMKDIPPAQGLIEKTLEELSKRKMTPLTRFFGKNPMTKESLSWYKGAIGEIEFAELLKRLPEGWTVFHSLPVGKGKSDVDHVLVSSAGIFSINSKNVKNKFVTVNTSAAGKEYVNLDGKIGKFTAKDYIPKSEYEAESVMRNLSAVGVEHYVTPLVVFQSSTEVRIKKRPRTVHIMQANDLLEWLDNQPKKISTDLLKELQEVLNDPETWGKKEVVPIDPAAMKKFSGLKKQINYSRRTQHAWAAAALVGLIALCGGGFFGGGAILLSMIMQVYLKIIEFVG